MCELAKRRESVWQSTLESLRSLRLASLAFLRDLIARQDADPEHRLRAALKLLEIFPVTPATIEDRGQTDADAITKELALEQFRASDTRGEAEQMLDAINGGPDIAEELDEVWSAARAMGRDETDDPHRRRDSGA
jgi:hypothetical protein